MPVAATFQPIHPAHLPQWKETFAKGGLILAENVGDRIVIVGRLINGVAHDFLPCLEMTGIDRGEPVLVKVAQDHTGAYRPFDGVHFH